jgi:hypothetical protein
MSKQRLFWAMLGLACIGAPLGAQSRGPRTDDYTVTVQNNRDEEVTVYLDAPPFERKLGTVEAMRSATFSLPRWGVRGEERVKLLIHPRGDHAFKAEGMLSDEGARLALMIPSEDNVEVTTERFATVRSGDLVGETTITVLNDRDEAAEVLFQSGSLYQRLGRVGGDSEITFRIPDRLVGMKGQVLLVPVNGSEMASVEVVLGNGEHLGVEVDD